MFGITRINNDDVTISDIVEWPGDLPGINVGRYDQVFSDMRARKGVSKTRYLDHIREMILRYIEEGIPLTPKNLSRSPVQSTGKTVKIPVVIAFDFTDF